MLDCIYHPGPENLSPIYIPEAGPEDAPFTEAIQNAQVLDAQCQQKWQDSRIAEAGW